MEVGTTSPSPGMVVTVELDDGTTLRRELLVGSSYLVVGGPPVHFGLETVTSTVRARGHGRSGRMASALTFDDVDGRPAADRRAGRPMTSTRASHGARRRRTGVAAGCCRAPMSRTRGPMADCARARSTPSARSPDCGTRRSSQRFAATSRHRPFTPATCIHSSAAMWDAWAAYDPTANGVFVDETRHRRRRGGGARGGDELCGLSRAGRAVPPVAARRDRRDAARRADGRALLRPFDHDDRR